MVQKVELSGYFCADIFVHNCLKRGSVYMKGPSSTQLQDERGREGLQESSPSPLSSLWEVGRNRLLKTEGGGGGGRGRKVRIKLMAASRAKFRFA